MENKDLILKFLTTPLDSGDEIFDMFATLPNAIAKKGEKPFNRFVYIPGTRKDRVLLVAHIDTVWDKDYQKLKSIKPHEHEVIFKDGVFLSGNEECGIGADDRAGCAMLWKLKDSGHSLLILDGEEDCKHGAWYLRLKHPKIYKEINRHSFMIELDHALTNHVSFAQVNDTETFKNYFNEATGFKELGLSGGCDLQVISKTICGANVGIGYRDQHKNNETLVLADWENTYNKLTEFLSKKQSKYKTIFKKRMAKNLRELVGNTLRKLKLKK